MTGETQVPLCHSKKPSEVQIKSPGDVEPYNHRGVTLEVDSVIAKAWAHALIAALRDMVAEMLKSTLPGPCPTGPEKNKCYLRRRSWTHLLREKQITKVRICGRGHTAGYHPSTEGNLWS